MKRIFLFLLLILSHWVMAQDFAMHNELKEIDSLIQYLQLETAQKKTDSLYVQLNKDGQKKNDKQQRLELKYRQALIIDLQNNFPAKSLQILLKITDEAEREQLHALSCRIYLLMALCYEKTGNFKLTQNYLDRAHEKITAHNLNEIYSQYFIRKSSYFRFMNDFDSSFYYAKQAELYAKKYNNAKELKDAYLLLGNYYGLKKDYENTLKYSFLHLRNTIQDTLGLNKAIQYNNISIIYFVMENYSNALIYSDSAYVVYPKLAFSDKILLPNIRYRIYEKTGNIDSAYHYFKQYHNDWRLLENEEQALKTKQLTEQYDNDKKEATIKSQNHQMIWIGSLLGIIGIASVLLFLQNRKINSRNKIINNQLVELTKIVEQKQVLLSELQHRVKNNLQHVISILEIQKESVDFNNIDELIRGNQNRIHSMALLHKKLTISDNVNEVSFKRYIAELAELVKDSYSSYKKKISLDVKCDIDKISLEKALPIGLILTELISNSMKYAFKKQNIGIITIDISQHEEHNQIYYADNGVGFDFKTENEKGLGLEIIKGLIDQLDGRVKAKNDNGFELSIYFK